MSKEKLSKYTPDQEKELLKKRRETQNEAERMADYYNQGRFFLSKLLGFDKSTAMDMMKFSADYEDSQREMRKKLEELLQDPLIQRLKETAKDLSDRLLINEKEHDSLFGKAIVLQKDFDKLCANHGFSHINIFHSDNKIRLSVEKRPNKMIEEADRVINKNL